MNYLFVILFVIICILFFYQIQNMIKIIDSNQITLNKKFNELDDKNKCPNTIKYFNNFQSGFITWPFGIAFALASGLLTLIILSVIYILNINKKNSFINPTLIFTMTIFITLISFIMTYKISNCFLSRMCAQHDCIN